MYYFYDIYKKLETHVYENVLYMPWRRYTRSQKMWGGYMAQRLDKDV